MKIYPIFVKIKNNKKVDQAKSVLSPTCCLQITHREKKESQDILELLNNICNTIYVSSQSLCVMLSLHLL